MCVIVGPPRSSLDERRGGPFWSECIILIWGMLFVCSSNDIPRVTAHIYLPLAPIKSIYLYAPVSRSDHLLFIILIYSQSIIHFFATQSPRRTGVPSPGISTFWHSINVYVRKASIVHRSRWRTDCWLRNGGAQRQRNQRRGLWREE